MKYTVIIPAFNAANTIEYSIRSVADCLDDCEIIVVENGSTDDTNEVVERLAQECPGVVLTHTEKGVSRARNEGIRLAGGAWIMFLDADDEWVCDQDRLDRITERYSDQQLICCSYFKKTDRITICPEDRSYRGEEELRRIRESMLSDPTLHLTAWAKIFRSSFLKENGLLFDKTLTVSEDSEFMLRCLEHCAAMTTLTECVCRYHRSGSTRIRTAENNRTGEFLRALNAVETNLAKTGAFSEESFIDYTIAQINLMGVHDIFNCRMNCSWSRRKEILKSVLEDRTIDRIIRSLTLGNLRSIRRLPAYLFGKHLYSMGGLICYLRSVWVMSRRDNAAWSR